MSRTEIETNPERREYVAGAVGFSPPSEAFRKDHLNSILRFLGGDALPTKEVYGPESPGKEWFYEQIADEAGFTYERGDGENARPYNSDELDDLVDAVDEEINSSTAI